MDENNNVVVRVPEQQFLRGEDGYSPVVTIEEIEHGHSVNITDREHQEEGQTFNVLDGASAYEQAVAGGYTGTEEQFAADLSSFKALHDETEEAAPFYAVYGVTTRSEIYAAINNKRQVYVKTNVFQDAMIIPLTNEFMASDWRTGYRFMLTRGTTQHVCELTSAWTSYANDLSAPADRAEEAAAQALNRMNSADQSAERASLARIDASRYANMAYAEAIEASIKAGEASNSATAADGSAKDAEAYAVGKRGGEPVADTDPTFDNNAKYYAERASASETAAEEAAPFYAVYGVTTKEEIAAAVNNKRQIFVRFNNEVTPVIPYFGTINYVDYLGQGIGYRFLGTDGALQHAVELKSSWSHYYNNLNEPAQRAEEAASVALNRMNSADQSAQSAAGSASNASRDAGTASTAAETATAKAGEASDSATAADGSAKDAEAYAVGKRGGTDVGSTDPAYHNNAKYYAEQAASSASDAVTAQGAAETAQGKAEDAQEAAEAVLESIPSDYTELSDDVDDLKSAINTKAPVIIDTASGAVASFDDGADGMPLKALTVNIEPVQSGTGDPSPTNVRPISGWTGCNIVHGGIGDISFTPNKAIDGSGNIVDSPGGGYSEMISASPADDAIVINNISAGQKRIRVHAYDAGGAWIRQVATINLLARDPAGFYKIPISLADTDKLLRISTGNLTEIKLVTVGHQIPITFPSEAGTVYGGTLTINADGSGELAVDKIAVKIKDAVFSWTRDSGGTPFYKGNSKLYPTGDFAICDCYKDAGPIIASNQNAGFHLYTRNITDNLRVRDPAFLDSSVSDWLAARGDNYICYQITAPTAYQLTAEQVTTLLGQNNIWADCGDVTVEYPADTKLYIQKINAPTDDDMTADTQIDSGKYFLVNNTLYLSTTVIPAGDIIIPGTNCQKTNLAAALNALNT